MNRCIPCLAALILACQAAGQAPPVGELIVSPNVRHFDPDGADAKKQQALVGKSVMVTLLRDGQVVKQREMDAEKDTLFTFTFPDVPHGSYTVRFEAAGATTTVKAGLVVNATSSPKVHADLVAGTGVRMVVFGSDADPLAELLQRVKKLEEAAGKGK